MNWSSRQDSSAQVVECGVPPIRADCSARGYAAFMRCFRCLVVASAFFSAASGVLPAQVYAARPKLVIELVIDQFRGDFLDRYQGDFKKPLGFNLFLQKGAYFTDCYYDYANTMTAPGHSTVGTGAYSNGHGIWLNEWWDLSRSTTHAVSSVEDERYNIVGDQSPGDEGTSPRSELASTLGDEVVLASQGRSKLFGISLKDRAAILTSGHASNGAFWLNHATGHFVSSTYWGPKLPEWVDRFNHSGRTEQAIRESGVKPKDFYEEVGRTPASVSYLLDFAKALMSAEQMGHHETTDVLTISISSTDMLGHRVGPDAPEQRAMIDAIDTDLDAFFGWVDKNVDGGMGSVWVSLTGDHGVGPAMNALDQARMPGERFTTSKLQAALNAELNRRFSPGKSVKYMLSSSLPYLQPDPRVFAELKMDEGAGEAAVKEALPAAFAAAVEPPAGGDGGRLPTQVALRGAYTHTELLEGKVPATEYGRLLLHSVTPSNTWYVMFTPGMYAQTTLTGTNHYTPYSYDRHVPLAFFGSAFVPGVYHGRVAPVDIAATFASLLRVNQPSASVGRVLTEALKPDSNGAGTTHGENGSRHGGK